MRFDIDIKHDVDTELKWSPELDSTDIATKVTDGGVTLYGFARTFHERHQAELSVKRIAGVTAVANDLAIRPNGPHKASDPQIARDAMEVLKLELPSMWDQIRIMVRQGRVVLEGTVKWQFVRERAESAVRRVVGIVDIRNAIQVAPASMNGDIKRGIEAALNRSAVVDSSHITVEVCGTEVTLTGTVRSWVEREEAQQSAWSAPGVTDVLDALEVRR